MPANYKTLHALKLIFNCSNIYSVDYNTEDEIPHTELLPTCHGTLKNFDNAAW